MRSSWMVGLGVLAMVTILVAAPIPKQRAENFGPVTEEQLTEAQNNLKQIMLALHNYESAMGQLPNNICDEDGKPILSWRVHLLPYLEEDHIWKLFKLDEPWDSKTNKELIEKMPKNYRPVRVKTKEKGMTYIRGFTGEHTLFEAGQKMTFANITDGTSNTIGVIEAGEPCIWTKPDDLPFDEKKELPKLGGMFDGDFHIGMMDGSVRFVKAAKMEAKEFKLAITRDDGEVFDADKAFGKDK